MTPGTRLLAEVTTRLVEGSATPNDKSRLRVMFQGDEGPAHIFSENPISAQRLSCSINTLAPLPEPMTPSQPIFASVDCYEALPQLDGSDSDFLQEPPGLAAGSTRRSANRLRRVRRWTDPSAPLRIVDTVLESVRECDPELLLSAPQGGGAVENAGYSDEELLQMFAIALLQQQQTPHPLQPQLHSHEQQPRHVHTPARHARRRRQWTGQPQQPNLMSWHNVGTALQVEIHQFAKATRHTPRAGAIRTAVTAAACVAARCLWETRLEQSEYTRRLVRLETLLAAGNAVDAQLIQSRLHADHAIMTVHLLQLEA